MRFYHFGSKTAPVIFLLPGTCCHWKANFGEVMPMLQELLVCYPEKWNEKICRCCDMDADLRK